MWRKCILLWTRRRLRKSRLPMHCMWEHRCCRLNTPRNGLKYCLEFYWYYFRPFLWPLKLWIRKVFDAACASITGDDRIAKKPRHPQKKTACKPPLITHVHWFHLAWLNRFNVPTHPPVKSSITRVKVPKPRVSGAMSRSPHTLSIDI